MVVVAVALLVVLVALAMVQGIRTHHRRRRAAAVRHLQDYLRRMDSMS